MSGLALRRYPSGWCVVRLTSDPARVERVSSFGLDKTAAERELARLQAERPFPVYATHADVRCFACNASLELEEPLSSGFAVSRGAYRKPCRTCYGLTTYYDLAVQPTNGLQESL